MLLSDFKRRWVLSKINPILFYIPGGIQGETIEGAKVIISPRTFIKQRFLSPSSTALFQVPFYTFSVDKKQAYVTGSIPKYKTVVSDNAETVYDNYYGCCYRLYKEIELIGDNNEKTYKYVCVNQNGKLDEDETDDSLFLNEQTFYLSEGNYYYREYISSEGDLLYFDTPKIKVFKKPTDYVEPDPPPIYDYKKEDLPEETADLLYIQYNDPDDGDKLHETFDGYDKYELKPVDKSSSLDTEEEEEYTTFKWYIYHNPKAIKTYTSFEWMDGSDYTLGATSIGSYSGWAIGSYTIGIHPLVGGGGGNIVSNPVKKLVPHIYKIEVMGKEVSLPIHETKKAGKKIKDTRGLIMIENGTIANPGIFDTEWSHYSQQEITLTSYYREITINDKVLSKSHILGYCPYMDSLAGGLNEDDYLSLYSEWNPSLFSGCGLDHRDAITNSFGTGIFIDRNGGASGKGGWTSTTQSYPSVSVSDKISGFNNTIREILIGVPVSSSTTTGYEERTGETTSSTIYMPQEPFEGKGYASAEDCAYFAPMVSRVATATYDTENAALIKAKGINTDGGYYNIFCDPYTYYDITVYEDSVGIKRIFTQTYDYNTFPDGHQAFYEKKQANGIASYPFDIEREMTGLAEGYGAAIIFNRQSRKFYKQYMGVEDDVFITDCEHYGKDGEKTYYLDPKWEEENN